MNGRRAAALFPLASPTVARDLPPCGPQGVRAGLPTRGCRPFEKASGRARRRCVDQDDDYRVGEEAMNEDSTRMSAEKYKEHHKPPVEADKSSRRDDDGRIPQKLRS